MGLKITHAIIIETCIIGENITTIQRVLTTSQDLIVKLKGFTNAMVAILVVEEPFGIMHTKTKPIIMQVLFVMDHTMQYKIKFKLPLDGYPHLINIQGSQWQIMILTVSIPLVDNLLVKNGMKYYIIFLFLIMVMNIDRNMKMKN